MTEPRVDLSRCMEFLLPTRISLRPRPDDCVVTCGGPLERHRPPRFYMQLNLPVNRLSTRSCRSRCCSRGRGCPLSLSSTCRWTASGHDRVVTDYVHEGGAEHFTFNAVIFIGGSTSSSRSAPPVGPAGSLTTSGLLYRFGRKISQWFLCVAAHCLPLARRGVTTQVRAKRRWEAQPLAGYFTDIDDMRVPRLLCRQGTVARSRCPRISSSERLACMHPNSYRH